MVVSRASLPPTYNPAPRSQSFKRQKYFFEKVILKNKFEDHKLFLKMPESPKKKPNVKKADHPPFAAMVQTAIATLKERKGSSRQAIEKYICTHYKVGPRYAVGLKAALKKGVETKSLLQVKGTGYNGSFKLAKKETEAKKAAPKKPASPKKPAAKKTAVKKPAAKKAASKPVTVKGVKSPKKSPAKKSTAKKAKPATKKTATPKKAPAPKKTSTTATPKKATPKKGKVVKKPAPKKTTAAKKTKK